MSISNEQVEEQRAALSKSVAAAVGCIVFITFFAVVRHVDKGAVTAEKAQALFLLNLAQLAFWIGLIASVVRAVVIKVRLARALQPEREAGSAAAATSSPNPAKTSELTEHESDEELWAKALHEFESNNRRPGLWARVFAEANGNDSVAKALYLRLRYEELRRKAIESAQIDNMIGTERGGTEATQPMGICPNCEAVIPLTSEECPKCAATFGPYSAWKVEPIPL